MPNIGNLIENIYLTFISIIRIFYKYRKVLKPGNLNLTDKEVVILGNGPSLNDSLNNDLDFINDRIKFCVGAFANTCYYEKLKPEFYIFADPFFWAEKSLERIERVRDQLIQSIITKTKWELIVYVPVEVKGNLFLIELVQKNKNIRIIYYNKITIDGFRWFRHFCYKHNIGIPRAQNVLVPALIFALNLGFQKIFVFGADHSWHENLIVDENNILCLKDVHFYNNEEDKLIPLRDPISGKGFRIHEQFHSLYITFKSYIYVEKYSKYLGAEIINCSKKSYIDAFQRFKKN